MGISLESNWGIIKMVYYDEIYPLCSIELHSQVEYGKMARRGRSDFFWNNIFERHGKITGDLVSYMLFVPIEHGQVLSNQS